MPEYTAPVDDLRFALKLSNHEDLTTWPGFEDASPDLIDMTLLFW